MNAGKPTAHLMTGPAKPVSVIDPDALEQDREWTRIEAISCLLAVIVLTALMIALVHITAQ